MGPPGTPVFIATGESCVCVLMMMKDFLILLLFIGFVVMTNYAATLATDAFAQAKREMEKIRGGCRGGAVAATPATDAFAKAKRETWRKFGADAPLLASGVAGPGGGMSLRAWHSGGSA